MKRFKIAGSHVSVYSLAIHGLLLFMGVEIFVLVQQNRALKEQLADVRERDARDNTLQAGDQVPSFRVLDLEGRVSEISYTGAYSSYLFFFFNTTCPVCKENLPNWKWIAESIDRTECRIVGISMHPLETTNAYVAANALSFEVLVPADSVFYRHYRPFSVPQTILIDSSGQVQQVFLGALSSEAMDLLREQITMRQIAEKGANQQ